MSSSSSSSRPARPVQEIQAPASPKLSLALVDDDFGVLLPVKEGQSSILINLPFSTIIRGLKSELQEQIKKKKIDLNFDEINMTPDIYIGTNFPDENSDQQTLSSLRDYVDDRKALIVLTAKSLTKELISKERQTALLQEEQEEKDRFSSGKGKKKKSGTASAGSDGWLERVMAEMKDMKNTMTEIKTENAEIKDRAARLEAENGEIQYRAARLEAENGEIQYRAARLEAENGEFKNRAARLEVGYKGMQAEISELGRSMRTLHRRVLLDAARDRLVERKIIDAQDRPTSDLAVLNILTEKAHNKLSTEEKTKLTKPVIEMIFKTGYNSVRSSGNQVAHNAEDKDIVTAITDSTLSSTVRKQLENVYLWVYKRERI